LEGEREIKLGLEDEIDIRKELTSLLEEQWVNLFVKIDFKRFNYKMEVKIRDWELDTLSGRLEKEIRIKNENGYANDSSLTELIHCIHITNYGQFRKIMRKRSEQIVERLPRKYEDMELI
jgi:hypothetical protein